METRRQGTKWKNPTNNRGQKQTSKIASFKIFSKEYYTRLRD